MGLLVLPSALLAWPIYYCLAREGFSTNDQSWLANFFVLGVVLSAMGWINQSLRRHGSPHSKWVMRVWLVVQPACLAVVSWPVLAINIWQSLPSFTLQYGILIVPSLLLQIACNRGERMRSIGWLPVFVVASLALTVDLFRWLGLLSAGLDFFALSIAVDQKPWGLVLVLLGAGCISSLVIPIWFLWCVDASPLNDEHSRRIELLWASFGAKSPQIKLWPTDCRISNAVVLGCWGRRSVLLTDRLLLTFTTREVDLVVLHELAHVLRFHGLIRLLPTILTVPFLFAALTWLSGVWLLVGCGAITIGFLVSMIATCWWTESDADRQAIIMASEYFKIDETTASREYGSVLQKLYRTNQIRKTSWSHPSLESRLSHLSR